MRAKNSGLAKKKAGKSPYLANLRFCCLHEYWSYQESGDIDLETSAF